MHVGGGERGEGSVKRVIVVKGSDEFLRQFFRFMVEYGSELFAEGVGDGWAVGEGFWDEGDWLVWRGLDGFIREGLEEFPIFGWRGCHNGLELERVSCHFWRACWEKDEDICSLSWVIWGLEGSALQRESRLDMREAISGVM